MDSSFTQWQSRSYPAGDAPFRAAEVTGPQPLFHDHLDALRSMWRRTPESEYPDGYIGTVESKRRERLKSSSLHRQNKPYTRGVHVGETRDPSSYFWPKEFGPYSAIEYEAQGMKYVHPGAFIDLGIMSPPEPNPTQPYFRTKKAGVPVRDGTAAWKPTNPDHGAQLQALRPPWSSGPGMAVPYSGGR